MPPLSSRWPRRDPTKQGHARRELALQGRVSTQQGGSHDLEALDWCDSVRRVACRQLACHASQHERPSKSSRIGDPCAVQPRSGGLPQLLVAQWRSALSALSRRAVLRIQRASCAGGLPNRFVPLVAGDGSAGSWRSRRPPIGRSIVSRCNGACRSGICSGRRLPVCVTIETRGATPPSCPDKKMASAPPSRGP